MGGFVGIVGVRQGGGDLGGRCTVTKRRIHGYSCMRRFFVAAVFRELSVAPQVLANALSRLYVWPPAAVFSCFKARLPSPEGALTLPLTVGGRHESLSQARTG